MTEPPAEVPAPPEDAGPTEAGSAAARFDELGQRPVAEHVAVFETEHARLQRELGTIDQL
jgi:hypothetical protein